MLRRYAIALVVTTLILTGVASARADVVTKRLSHHDVLVFDDGYDGITAVDLDARVAVRRAIHGRAGDQPVRLSRIGDSLVVGWGEVFAAPLDGSEPHLIGEATLYLPAAEAGLIWLVEYPGGHIGAGVPMVRQVDLEGSVLVERAGLDPRLGPPVIAIKGGLVYQSPVGLLLWDSRSDSIIGRLDGSFPSDVHDATLAWCEGACAEMHFKQIGGPDVAVTAPRDGDNFAGYEGSFSPDGRSFAAPTHSGVAIIDVEGPSIDATIPAKSLQAPLEVGWSPDSRRLYFFGSSHMESRTTIGVYTIATGTTTRITLPFGGLLSLLVVDRSEAEALVQGELGPKGACPPPKIQPSGRTNACAFEF